MRQTDGHRTGHAGAAPGRQGHLAPARRGLRPSTVVPRREQSLFVVYFLLSQEQPGLGRTTLWLSLHFQSRAFLSAFRSPTKAVAIAGRLPPWHGGGVRRDSSGLEADVAGALHRTRMWKIWTMFQHDGPDHLGLWLSIVRAVQAAEHKSSRSTHVHLITLISRSPHAHLTLTPRPSRRRSSSGRCGRTRPGARRGGPCLPGPGATTPAAVRDYV